METVTGREPRSYAWILPGRLAVAERPGGGGRSHRRARRDAELAWWQEQGVTGVLSAMRSRHGLLEYALAGLRVRWWPLADPDAARGVLPDLVSGVREMLEEAPGAVLVHCDRPGEWLAALDAALRMAYGLAPDAVAGLAQAAADGFPVGDLAVSLLGRGSATPAAAAGGRVLEECA